MLRYICPSFMVLALVSSSHAKILDSTVSETAPAQGSPIIEDYVKEELLPEAESTLNALQAEVTRLEDDVEKCNEIMLNHGANTSLEESDLTSTEKAWILCDDTHNQAKTMETACVNWKALVSNLKWPEGLDVSFAKSYSEKMEILTKQFAFVSENAATVKAASEECTRGKEAAAKHIHDCDGEREALEKAFCALKDGLSDECGQYETCYAAKLTVAQNGIKKVMKLEEHNKEAYRYRKCFNKENCDPKTVDTSVLDVNYKSMPEKGTCIQGIHTERQYPNINCSAVLEPAAESPAADSVATENVTEAPAVTESSTTETVTEAPAVTEAPVETDATVSNAPEDASTNATTAEGNTSGEDSSLLARMKFWK